ESGWCSTWPQHLTAASPIGEQNTEHQSEAHGRRGAEEKERKARVAEDLEVRWDTHKQCCTNDKRCDDESQGDSVRYLLHARHESFFIEGPDTQLYLAVGDTFED